LRAALALALVALSIAGCLESSPDGGEADGHYVYFSWSHSQKSCVNGRCTYGSNSEPFSQTLECASMPMQSWDANGWVHGSVTARVKDGSGAEVGKHIVSGNGKGSEVVQGKAGTWTFEGTTSDANGSMQMRLTCQ
jgi:hypothetical protein